MISVFSRVTLSTFLKEEGVSEANLFGIFLSWSTFKRVTYDLV